MSSTTQGQSSLLRGLSRFEAVAVVVGGVIGSGIFFKPPQIAAVLGDFWLIIAVWIAAGGLCLLGALCIAELAAMLPQAGGLYVYLSAAYGKFTAFLYGWTLFWIVRPSAIGALATAFSLALPLGELARLAISLALIGTLAWVNMRGVIWGGQTQNITTLIKAGFLVCIALLPLLLGYVDPGNFTSGLDHPREESLLIGIGVALLAVLWAYDGWHEVTPLAEEIQDPQRNLPWALFVGVGILIVLYVSANVAYHSVLSMSEIASERNVAAGLMNRTIGSVGGALMVGIVMCSVFGAINTNLLHGPRVFFAMSRDRLFFSQLGRVHATRRTPSYAIASQAVLACSLIVIAGFVPVREIQEPVAKSAIVSPLPEGYEDRVTFRPVSNVRTTSDGENITSDGVLAFRGVPMRWSERVELELLSDSPSYHLALEALYNRSNRHVFDLLTNLVVFGTGAFYVLTVAGVIILRRRSPDLHRPYRTWGYPVVPLVFLSVYVWFLSVIFLEQPIESLFGLAVIATGAPAYFLWNRQRVPPGTNSGTRR